MFTGIIEEIGTIATIRKGARSIRLTINAQRILDDLKLGDSVAVNGVCLTVDDLSAREFSADVMPETMQRTGFKSFTSNTAVNLERALSANGRFGGHLVSGHIDDVGMILSQKKDDSAVWLQVSAPNNVLNFLVEKGSVTIDGVSLTVVDVLKSSFTISMIPHTAVQTTLLQKQTGEEVNIECDLLSKYIHKFLDNATIGDANRAISADFLRENGF